MITTRRTRMFKWVLLLASGILFGSTCDAVFGTLNLAAGIVDIWV